MSVHRIIVNLPEPTFRQIERRGRQKQSSIEDELVTVVTRALPEEDELPAELEHGMAQLAHLTDDELWQTARSTLSPQENARMQALLLQSQSAGLTPDEEREAQQLSHRYDHTLLIRAQAAILLQQRGHNVASLGPNPPSL